jgi:hypothetical protein
MIAGGDQPTNTPVRWEGGGCAHLAHTLTSTLLQGLGPLTLLALCARFVRQRIKAAGCACVAALGLYGTLPQFGDSACVAQQLAPQILPRQQALQN